VLKIPVDPRSAVGEDNNWRMLQALIQDPAIADLMPKPRARGVHQRLSYFVESAVAGRPLTSAITDIGRARAAGKIKELFLKMHAGRRTPTEVAAGTTAFDFFVERPVSQLRMAAFEPELCDALQTYLRNGIAEEPWSLGLYHGDFTSDNIFVLGDQISGVIDWEYATADGIAPLDVISYLESMQRSTNPLTTATTNLTRLASWDWPSSEEIDLLKSIYAHFRIAPERHEFLCRLSWMQHVGNILDTTARFDAAFKEYIRRSLAEVVRT